MEKRIKVVRIQAQGRISMIQDAKRIGGEYNRVGKLWTVTITPSRSNGHIGEINRGGGRGRYSKDIGRVRQLCIKWDKHEVHLYVCRKKPSGVCLTISEIFDLLPNVAGFHIPHPH